MVLNSQDSQKMILIACPICKKQKRIPISSQIFENIKNPLATLRLEKNMVCEHEFIVYIDRNLNVRGELASDFIISPVIQTEKTKPEKIELEKIEPDIIKFNLYQSTLCYLLGGLLSGGKMVYLIEEENEFLKPSFNNFIKYLFSNSFEIKDRCCIETIKNYKSEKKKFKDFIILKNVEIIQDKKKVIKSLDLRVERGMTKNFFENMSHLESMIYLHKEIQTAFILTNSVLELFKNDKEIKDINMNKIIEYLEKSHDIKVDIKYGEFLIHIVKDFYQKKIPNLYKGMEFSKFFKLSERG